MVILPPILFPSTDISVDLVARSWLAVCMACRTLELAAMPRSYWVGWKGVDYVQFLANSDNRVLKRLEKNAVSRRNERNRKLEIPLGPGFFPAVATQFVQILCIYIVSRAYLEKYPAEFDEWFLDLTDITKVFACIMFGALAMSHIMFSFLVSRLPLVFIFKIPLCVNFDRPFLVTSLSEFWAKWDIRINTTLYNCVFYPLLNYMQRAFGTNRATSLQLAVAIFTTFLASAALHEYVQLLFMPTEPFGPNAVFFTLHGALLVCETLARSASGFGRSWGTGFAGRAVGWLVTMTVLLVTCPMFARPFAHYGIFRKMPVPEFILDFVKELI
ncbi:hypothetical protein HDU83_004309 [Entophlyctis luteolus]|nr:hypothetical protein HDU83_004309 [Entophlyctis luteolus]